jgi:hypothetical protein
MRVVSLVPSLTETLLECGVEVVGRTRFCIHPADRLADIPAVGGTKEVNWQRCLALAPDIVVMDREENTLEMAKSCPVPWVATHITSVDDVGRELDVLADRLCSDPLAEMAADWRALAAKAVGRLSSLDSIPGETARIGQPERCTRVEYLIWRDPWMTVGRHTFIGSMLERVGLGDYLDLSQENYPQLPTEPPHADTCYLLSSEPYPFERYLEELQAAGFNGVLVDGEFYSWFGVRSYRALNNYLLNS